MDIPGKLKSVGGLEEEDSKLGSSVKPINLQMMDHEKSEKYADMETKLFTHLENAKGFAIDVGGSLTKVAYFSTIPHNLLSDDNASDSPNVRDGIKNETKEDLTHDTCSTAKLHFTKFETKFIGECLDFLAKHLVVENSHGRYIKATGGGCHKYSDLIENKLELKLEKEDEIQCLIKGANFLFRNVPNEVFAFERKPKTQYKFLPAGPVLFPYLLVNIGSGVSILKVESDNSYERIGGTATGGGTFWGLGSLLTGINNFDELLKMADKGNHRNLDMLVKDIYSGDYEALGLPGDVIASSFGKAAHAGKDAFKPEDCVRSLLFTIVNDIGQIACLYALQHHLKRIYFGGFFLRNHPLSMEAITYSIRYWSKDTVQALFLRHEGYLCAIGAFLKGVEGTRMAEYSWQENYANSTSGLIGDTDSESSDPILIDLETLEEDSDLSSLEKEPDSKILTKFSIEHLEIDRIEKPMGFFPLLSSDSEYVPDTVDLTKDQEGREYWLKCFVGWVERIASKAMESQPSCNSNTERALKCKQKLLARLRLLKERPFAYGILTVRSLLDTIEHCLRDFNFPDLYRSQKRLENAYALGEFSNRINYLDSLSFEKRQEEAIWGILAGNVFDWGAKAVTDLLEGPDHFGFEEARSKLQQRPWLIDGMDEWIERLKEQRPHKNAVVFVDNSGSDFVLGIVPMVRELLKMGTSVIICANSAPAVNDMTYSEMVPLMQDISTYCNIISEALEDGRLMLEGNGQGSPCLDLSRVAQDLIDLVKNRGTDLVILEGMGRVIHTNLYSKFSCEVLKLAVVKNQWLANRLGGPLFSVIAAYEKPWWQ